MKQLQAAVLVFLVGCGQQHHKPFVPPTSWNAAIALVESRYPADVAKVDKVSLIALPSRMEATKQRPFYCPNEIVVSGFQARGPKVDPVVSMREWRVNLGKKLASESDPTEVSAEIVIAKVQAEIQSGDVNVETTPEPIRQCLDGAEPLLLDPATLDSDPDAWTTPDPEYDNDPN